MAFDKHDGNLQKKYCKVKAGAAIAKLWSNEQKSEHKAHKEDKLAKVGNNSFKTDDGMIKYGYGNGLRGF